MKTTVNIPDPLMREAKEYAARHGTTITELVAEGLRTVVQRNPRGSVELPVSPRSGGPAIDLSDRSAVWDHAT
jgi:hypothetical protein